MRILLDLIAVLTATGLAVAVFTFERKRTESDAKISLAASDLRRLELEIKYRSVTKTAELNELGWPDTVDPAWFDTDPPHNCLVSDRRPWLEICSADDADQVHPRVRLAVDETLAGFWYNPYQGVVRARVPVMLSDADSIALYNRVNRSALLSLFDKEPRPVSADEQARAGGEAVRYKSGDRNSIPVERSSRPTPPRRPIGSVTAPVPEVRGAE